MKAAFIHLSDFHFITDKPESIELVSSELFRDIPNQTADISDKYIIFSGDFVKSGSDTESFLNLSNKLKSEFPQAGIQLGNYISVPGNHDVSRVDLENNLFLMRAALSNVSSENQFNELYEKFDSSFFKETFKNYRNFESSLFNYTCTDSSTSGSGWKLNSDISVYCLNSALCSCGGLGDTFSKIPISDKKTLMINTRNLYDWVLQDKSKFRILVMHHPTSWLADWAEAELEKIIADKFDLVFSGHVHKSSSKGIISGDSKTLKITAPALFSNKENRLGYTITTLDTQTKEVTIKFREWTDNHKFVKGTCFSHNDSGEINYNLATAFENIEREKPSISAGADTLSILKAEYEEAIVCYSSKKSIWIERDLADIPEVAQNQEDAVIQDFNDFINAPKNCIITAPKQFGLTTLGRHIAYERYRNKEKRLTTVFLDLELLPNHRQAILSSLDSRYRELNIIKESVDGIILDNWNSSKKGKLVLEILQAEFEGSPIILLHSVDANMRINDTIDSFQDESFELLYLWSLSRSKIRSLTSKYLSDDGKLDDNQVTDKIIKDLDALNIHRSPLNCLLILKLIERAFDDSPVNRTEMIGRVLYILFYEFDEIPRYATRPDLKDCEFALGYFSEWLLRNGACTFKKKEFFEVIQNYCTKQYIDLDVDVLFSFLASENIFIRSKNDFRFRFNYWLFYFAAHRMHHDDDFSEFVLTDYRYAAFPEIIEFYTGIDRRRSNAIEILSSDLEKMNKEFSERTKIDEDFNPFRDSLWKPSNGQIKQLREEVTRNVAESSLPDSLKDAIADKHYDRAKPYNQEIAKFISESSLRQLMFAVKGAARALRNSDYVSPELKTKLLNEVLKGWTKVSQALIVISPVLARNRAAFFENIYFVLDSGFDDLDTKARWNAIMSAIIHNILQFFESDIFSKRMGALLCDHISGHKDELSELLAVILLIRHRPTNWEKETKKFILKEDKNSYYLGHVFRELLREFKVSFTPDRTRLELRRLAAIAIAKHDVGVKKPNKKLLARAEKYIDEKTEN